MGAIIHPLAAKFAHRDRSGNIIWETAWIENSLADEGEQDILDIIYRASTAPTTFYTRLYNDTPVDTDTLALLTGEASGNGYGALTWNRNSTDFPTLALDAGDYQVSSVTKQYSASGGSWGPVTYMVLATVATGTAGKIYNYFALSQSRTLADGEKLDVSMKMKLA